VAPGDDDAGEVVEYVPGCAERPLLSRPMVPPLLVVATAALRRPGRIRCRVASEEEGRTVHLGRVSVVARIDTLMLPLCSVPRARKRVSCGLGRSQRAADGQFAEAVGGDEHTVVDGMSRVVGVAGLGWL